LKSNPKVNAATQFFNTGFQLFQLKLAIEDVSLNYHIVKGQV